MRIVVAWLMLAAVTGCSDRRSFDDRYSDTANDVEQRAARMEADANSVEPNNQIVP